MTRSRVVRSQAAGLRDIHRLHPAGRRGEDQSRLAVCPRARGGLWVPGLRIGASATGTWIAVLFIDEWSPVGTPCGGPTYAC